MDFRKLPGTELGKFLSLLQIEPSWISTLEFKNFLGAMRASDKELDVYWGDDFAFFLEPGASGTCFVHGIFCDWNSLSQIKDQLKGRGLINLSISPAVPVLRCSEGIVMRRKGSKETSMRPGTSVTMEEVIQLIQRQSPELLNAWFIDDVKKSLEANAYRCLKNSRGKIEYLQMMRPEQNHYQGIYVMSSLAFPETLSEFYASHSMARGQEVRAVVFRENEASMQMHKLLGYEEAGKSNYYCEFISGQLRDQV